MENTHTTGAIGKRDTETREEEERKKKNIQKARFVTKYPPHNVSYAQAYK